MKYLVVLTFFGLACISLASRQEKVEFKIWKNLEEYETTNILVTFKKANTQAAFARFKSLGLTNRDDKLNTQYAILKAHADEVQTDVIEMLKKKEPGKKHEFSQLWISAELIVRYVDRDVVERLSNHSDVENLNAEWFIPLEPVMSEETDVNDDVQWGVSEIRAQNVWDEGISGEGVVVAAIDTGCSYTHESLLTSYRGNIDGKIDHDYNWFDPTAITGASSVPNDLDGHGTHVTGTMCGNKNGIGVAPDAKWIHCKGCGTSFCSSIDLQECGNWMACPTDRESQNRLCSKAPNVVNNSWGGPGGSNWFSAIITAWRNADIVPVFAAGNSGPSCGTMQSPGDDIGSIGVASTSNNNQVSRFSSVGPTIDNRVKPDVAAPGENIISASSLSITGYRTMSGTSMATPHVAGLVALILSSQPDYNVEQVTDALRNGAVAVTSGNNTCNGIPDSTLPNNFVGSGRIDAFYSVIGRPNS